MAHAFVIEAPREEGVAAALAHIERAYGLAAHDPDVTVLRYGLLSVEDARDVANVAARAPLGARGTAIVLAADRAYHEAQNALLKLFEEPPPGAHLFLTLPSLGGLLPTLRSRVQVLSREDEVHSATHGQIAPGAEEFLQAKKEKRSALIKKLAIGKNDDERRAHRAEAIAIINGIEVIAYERFKKGENWATELLSDIATARGYLYDRSAPVRLILEHVSLAVDAACL